MPLVDEMVTTAVKHGHPGLALTDHGVMAGSIRLYKACRKADILPFPGSEFYLVSNVDDKSAKEDRYHVGMVALNFTGYQKLIALSSRSHTRDRFHRKPLIDFADLADLDAGTDIALTTGCYFGLPIQTLIYEGPARAKQTLEAYAKLFPLTFVEIQNHYTQHDPDIDDELIAIEMYSLASELGLPVIIGQDAHYCEYGDKAVHDLMKQMTMVGSDPNTVVFPGDSYHLSTTRWVKSHFDSNRTMKAVWNASLASCQYLLENNKLWMPELETYSFRVPEISKAPDKELEQRCLDELALLPPTVWTTAQHTGLYKQILGYELSVISDVGFADYFLLVVRVTDWCKQQKIMCRARGSAASSLVCYLLGITDVDPVAWGLDFDRFLTRDRSKPPDIDLDIEDVRRSEVVEWVSSQYDLAQIGTYSTLGYSESTDRGSIVDDYVRMRKRITGNWQGNFMADIPDLDRAVLMRLSEMKVKRSVGSHAAGYVLGTKDVPIDKYLPKMLIPSSGSRVTQPPMDDVEDAGYVKVDFLGMRTLTALRYCLTFIGRDPQEGAGWIPLDDASTMAMLRTGKENTGLFQLEGGSASRGCREMEVKTTKNLVELMALYRPASLDSGYTDAWLTNRNNTKAVVYAHPIIKKHLRETHGVCLYQEQVLAIMRDLGMSVEELNEILTALKVKHGRAGHSQASDDAFDKVRESFGNLCAAHSLTPEATEQVWELVEGFSAYGFNRAHATSYGVLAYWMAYLKYYHPLQFMASVLITTVHNTDYQRDYAREARRLGLTIKQANVNRSLANWSIDGTGLRRGLMSLSGVGARVAEELEEHAPYADLDDLIARTNSRVVTGGKSWAKSQTLNGSLEHLRQSGALECLGVKRG